MTGEEAWGCIAGVTNSLDLFPFLGLISIWGFVLGLRLDKRFLGADGRFGECFGGFYEN